MDYFARATHHGIVLGSITGLIAIATPWSMALSHDQLRPWRHFFMIGGFNRR